MEIRIENTINIDVVKQLKEKFDDFFSIDFNVHVDGDYIYFRGTE